MLCSLFIIIIDELMTINRKKSKGELGNFV
jgi:hypothetical protein